MSHFTREAPGIRLVESQHGDTLQRLALRELGDASRWVEIVELNGLRPPYLSDIARPGVLAYGASIRIPSPTSRVSASEDPAAVYGGDLRLWSGALQVENGDFVVVAGVPNLTQALRHRVLVDKRELGFHPEYGCYIRSLLGMANGPVAGQLAAFYVKSALLEDERVSSVPSCVAEVVGDQLRVFATVVPVSGAPVDISVVV